MRSDAETEMDRLARIRERRRHNIYSVYHYYWPGSIRTEGKEGKVGEAMRGNGGEEREGRGGI